MPSADTFDCPPIEGFVKKYLMKSKVSVDPFARNRRWATYTNDLNPRTAATHHLEALDFLAYLGESLVKADLLIFDPPYSPRQLSECYSELGIECSHEDTQNGRFYREIRDAANGILSPGAVVLSFGWNSSGMGKERRFEQVELLLVAHGGGHNDTICLAEQKLPVLQGNLFTHD